MDAIVARRLLRLVTAGLLQIDGLDLGPPSVVQAVEVVFASAVVYDRETGGLCPMCHTRGRVTHTDAPDASAKARQHFCDKCSRPFRSIEQVDPREIPAAMDKRNPPRQHRSRKRRS